MRHTLVDFVEHEKQRRRMRAAAGNNKSTVQPKIPGQQADQGDQPPPIDPKLAGPPQPATAQPPQPQPTIQPPPAVGYHPPAPQAQALPGQMPPPKPGMPQYPGGQQPPQPDPNDKNAMPPKGKKPPMEDEDQDPQNPNQPHQAGPMKPPPANAAEHVANHVQDPLGSTHDMFQRLGQKQLEYEMEKETARRSLAPVKAVLQHVDQLHQLTPQNPMGMNPDEAMGYQDPNNPQGNNVPMGGQGPMQPMQPGMAGKPGAPMMPSKGQNDMMPGAKDPGAGGPPAPGGKKPPKAGGEGGEAPGGKGAAGKKAGGKKISMTVEGARDLMAARVAPKLRNIMASVDLNTVKVK